MTKTIDTARLHRFMLAIGEDGYQKLTASQVTIVFDSIVGKYAALPLAAAGVPLKLLSASRTSPKEQLIDIPIKDKNRARGYAQALREFNGNPNLETVVGAEAGIGCYATARLLEGSSVVIDCTNSMPSKEASLSHARKAKIPFISFSVVPGYARLEVEVAMPDAKSPGTSVLMPGMAEAEADLAARLKGEPKMEAGASLTKEMAAMFMGGIAADEAVKMILGKGQPLSRPLYLKFGYGDEIFSPRREGEELRFIAPDLFGDKSALLFGVGAVGANAAFWLSRMGTGRVDTLDDDTVDLTNVMRTLFYHQHVGKPKAQVASQKIRELSGGATLSDYFSLKLAPGWKPKHNYDIYVDGFDNFPSRNLAHQLAIAYNTPVISASGRFDGFDMEAYLPGKTLCFDCNFGLSRLAEKEEANRRDSCTVEFTPQNTWINQSVGALAAMLIASALQPERYGSVPNGMVMYDAMHDSRLLINTKSGACALRNGEMHHGT